jgi:hypothetical protein
MTVRRTFVVTMTLLCVASASASAHQATHVGRTCRGPRLKGLTLTVARTRAAHAGCRLRVKGAALEDARIQTVERQSPRPGRRSASVTVWLNPITVKANEQPPNGQAAPGSSAPQAPPGASPLPSAPPECWGSAEYGPEISEPFLTAGPTELVSGFYLDGGPPVSFSAPNCERPAQPPWAGTVEVMSAGGAVVATQTSEKGHFAEILLPAGSYTIVGTFERAIINGARAKLTESVVIPAGYTVRQDFILNIP